MGKTLLSKTWEAHSVRQLDSGQTQLFIGLHLVHEVTSPQAFQMLRERDLKYRFPNRQAWLLRFLDSHNGSCKKYA